jgi:hypothetical protein
MPRLRTTAVPAFYLQSSRLLLLKGAPKIFFGFTLFSYFLGSKPVHSTQNLVLVQKPFCHHGGPPRGLLEGNPFIGIHFSVT